MLRFLLDGIELSNMQFADKKAFCLILSIIKKKGMQFENLLFIVYNIIGDKNLYIIIGEKYF